MNQYVSRRRRCWTLLVQMDPVTHLGEGHRSDMLLDPSSASSSRISRIKFVPAGIVVALVARCFDHCSM